MDNALIVAIIAGTASLLVALTSLITTLINGRITYRTAESVERLKNEFSYSNRLLDILDLETKTTLQNLKDSIQAIQKLKNEMQRFKIDKESALATGVLDKINEAAIGVIENFNLSQTSLSELERKTLHRAKNIAIYTKTDIEQLVLKMKKYKKADLVKGISENFDSFDKFHNELSENQRILWDCRADRILNLSQNSLIKLPK